MRVLQKIVDVKEHEVSTLLLSVVYFFFILSSYYVIRPIRDEMGVAGGVDNLPWLFTGTMVGMIIANPIFASLVVKLPRHRFIPLAYRIFILQLLIFFLLLTILSKTQSIWVGRIFYIWTSIFNLFVVSIFWSFMIDIFAVEQGKRLFGFISVGGTLGSVLGAAVTSILSERLGPVNLLLISALLLEVGVQCARRFPVFVTISQDPTQQSTVRENVIGGGVLAGVKHVYASPYMLGICAYMLIFTITNTFLYFQQSDIAARNFVDRAARTAFFAKIDLVVNILTVLIQVFLTGRVMRFLGVSITLALLSIISLAGFTVVGVKPILALIVAFQILRRVGNLGFARPAREVLFIVLSPEDKYKAKSFIDTFIFRTGDQIGAWAYPALNWLGFSIAKIPFVAIPLSLIWLVVSIWLGHQQAVMVSNSQESESHAEIVVTKMSDEHIPVSDPT
ncbi:MAG: MFS transporter [Acidobacteriota bacterium]